MQAVLARVRADVRLGPDAVELVLDGESVGHLPGDVVGIVGSCGEHELDRVEQPHLGFAEAAVSGQNGRLAEVAREHVRALHRAHLVPVPARQRRLDAAFFEPDPQIPREELDEVLRRAGVQHAEQVGDVGRLRLRTAQVGQFGQKGFGVGEGEGGRGGALGQSLGGDVARVAEGDEPCLQRVARGAADGCDGAEQYGVADVDGALVAERERPSGDEPGRPREVGVGERCDVRRQPVRLVVASGEVGDGVGGLGEGVEAAGVRHRWTSWSGGNGGASRAGGRPGRSGRSR